MDLSPRPLGRSDHFIPPIGLGCWPLAGMTREGITREVAVATVLAALDAGISHLDTAYCYGADGESEKAIGTAIHGRPRSSVFLAGKCGIHWEPGRKQCVDGRPDRLRREVEESLRRLGVDSLDLLYLHAPDPCVPLETSMAELGRLQAQGLTRTIGISNVSLEELRVAAEACPLAACQLPYNMLQREIERDIVPWCVEQGVAIVAYWPLMKGLLAGGMARGRTFPLTDSRHKYPMFQGAEFQRNLDFVDVVQAEADRLGTRLPDLVLAWTTRQPGITSVLFGATSPEQVVVNAAARSCVIDAQAERTIAAGIAARGPIVGRRPV